MSKDDIGLNNSTTKVNLNKPNEFDVEKVISVAKASIIILFIIMFIIMSFIVIRISHKTSTVYNNSYYTDFISENLECSTDKANEILNLIRDNGVNNIVNLEAYHDTDKVILKMKAMNDESTLYCLVYENKDVSAILKLDSSDNLEILYTVDKSNDYTDIKTYIK